MRKLLAEYDSEEDDDYQPTKLEEANYKSQLVKNKRAGLTGKVDVNQLWEELQKQSQSYSESRKKPKLDPSISNLELARSILESKEIRVEKKVMFAGKQFIMDERSGQLKQVEKPAIVVEQRQEGSQEMGERDHLQTQYRYLNHVVSMLRSRYRNINSIYKSKLDWRNFVKKEGIEDRLSYNRKGGALEDYRFMKKKEPKM